MAEHDPTLRIQLDARALDRAAFEEESPTTPAPFDFMDLVELDTAGEGTWRTRVDWILPADFVPILRVARTDLVWRDLSPLAVQIVMRVDGAVQTADLLARVEAEPASIMRELRDLVQRGVLGFRA